jgi:HEXXH motif-containing protein
LTVLSPEQLYAFEPDAARAGFIDQRVRTSLAASLDVIFAQVGDALALEPERCAALSRAVQAGPVSPRLVATYADLVEAIYRDDDAAARALAHTLLTDAPGASGLRALNLLDGDLGKGQAERYARHALEESQGIVLAPVSPQVLAKLSPAVDEVMLLLDTAAPALCGEIRALMRQIVFVQGVDAQSNGFGGATTFYLWGAMLLNATRLDDRMALLTAIIHEAAHSFLFGVNLGARLTKNDDEDLCASPLRTELRPVEGVFHATFVLARMIYGLDHLLNSGHLAVDEAARAKTAVDRHLEDFHAGLRSLSIARFSSAGALLLDAATRYVTGRDGSLGWSSE